MDAWNVRVVCVFVLADRLRADECAGYGDDHDGGIIEGSGRFFSWELVLTIWSASTGFLSLMDALGKIYGVRDERSYLKRRVIAVQRWGGSVFAGLFRSVERGAYRSEVAGSRPSTV